MEWVETEWGGARVGIGREIDGEGFGEWCGSEGDGMGIGWDGTGMGQGGMGYDGQLQHSHIRGLSSD